MKHFNPGWFLAFFSLLSLFPSITCAQNTTQVKDIKTGSLSSLPTYLTGVGSLIFFAAEDTTTNGTELWKSDGTTDGTVMVKNINSADSSSSYPQYLTDVNGTLFFSADDGGGSELWQSDGTEANTAMVKNINPSGPSNPNNFAAVGTDLFFAATTGTYGTELWKSDGTDAGTLLVKDINSATASSSPSYLTNVNGTLFFAADDGTTGTELWKSDGTAAGTELVQNIKTSIQSSYPSELTAIGSTLYFAADGGTIANDIELWKSDGTAAGTTQVKDINPGGSSNPSYLTNVNGVLFFAADSGSGTRLWRSDGTVTNTYAVTAQTITPTYLTAMNGTLFFAGTDDGTTGTELWKSDGTDSGTVMVLDINPGTSSGIIGDPCFTPSPAGFLFFAADNGMEGGEPWKTDGTLAGTNIIQAVNPGINSSYPSDFEYLSGILFFAADDGTTGSELWKFAAVTTTTSSIDTSSSSSSSSSSSGGGGGGGGDTATTTTTSTAPAATTTTTAANTTTSKPPADITIDFTGTPVRGTAPFKVTFVNTSAGAIAGFVWDFGDGTTSALKNPEHTYMTPGEYTVSLTAETLQGKYITTKNSYIVVSKSPLAADFSAAPARGNAPLTVVFTDTSTGSVSGWLWNFGDNASSTQQNPEHTYTAPGSYTVGLAVTGPDGSAARQKVDYIVVTQDAPAPAFTASQTEGPAPLTVLFTDTSAGTIAERQWNFGDGATGSRSTELHTYTVPGLYSVTLTAGGPEGSSSITKENLIAVQPAVFAYTASGTVSGDIIAGIQISLGDLSTVSDADGAYEFAGVANGAHTVTPFMRGLLFDPPGREIRVAGADITGIDFTALQEGPVIETALASPAQVPADGRTLVMILAQVVHPGGLSAIDAVSADLSPIGGSPGAALHDDGTGGDETAGDGLFSLQTSVDNATAPGPKAITVRATDIADISARASLVLAVSGSITPTVPPSQQATYPIENDLQGQTLIIQYTLQNEETDSSVRRNAASAATGEGSLLLQIFTPDNSPYLTEEVPITGTLAEINIANADQGAWAYQITNTAPVSQSCNIQTTTAGTGIVSGSVIDAASGTALDGVAVRTSSNASSVTIEGYYVLLHPAGSFTISATDPDHAPTSKSFTVSAGSSVEINMILGAGGSNSSTCFLESTAPAQAARHLALLRAFRDSFLKKTPEGRRLVNLYYEYSPQIALLLARDKTLRDQLWGCILNNLSLIQKLSENKPAKLSKAQVTEIEACLQRLRDMADGQLADDISGLIHQLHDSAFLSRLTKQ